MKYFERVKGSKEIQALIKSASNCLEAMNYTEHGFRHMGYVSYTAMDILRELGYDLHMQELARIAGFLHDVGNTVSRKFHGITSATLVYPILKELGLPYEDICIIVAAIGNHEEEYGVPVNAVGAAIIIADKSDAHRTRVKRNNRREGNDDIHDRVNYSIIKNRVLVNKANMSIASKFYMDMSSSVMEYFKIYLSRIDMSEKAAHFLGCSFKLFINDVLINSPKAMSASIMNKIKDDAETVAAAEDREARK